MPLPRSFKALGEFDRCAFKGEALGEFDRCAFKGEALGGEFDRWSCAFKAVGNVGRFIFRALVGLAALTGLGLATLGLAGLTGLGLVTR